MLSANRKAPILAGQDQGVTCLMENISSSLISITKEFMKVYGLYHTYYDYCDFWETLVALYANKDCAELALLNLLEIDHDGEKDSWEVRELIVK